LAKGILKKLMNFRKFLTFSALICAGAFLLLALRFDSWPILQSFMNYSESVAGLNGESALDWPRAFTLLSAFIGLGAIALYFFAKNLSTTRYGGIFVLYLVLVIVTITALIL
jgi:hypothetical protein